MIGSARKRLLIALLFLLPNLLGFLVFTAGPIVFSFYMSLTNWALTRHNRYSTQPIEFIGLDNYTRLLVGDESAFFWDYFGNTIFLMLGLPFSIAGSLLLAVLLSSRTAPASRRGRWTSAIVAGAVSVVLCLGAWLFTTPGPTPEPGSPLLEMSREIGLTDRSVYEVSLLRSRALVLALGVLGAIVTFGLLAGNVFFRTIFYLPSLLAGVAMFLFWKTLYRPQGGLINATLEPILDAMQALITATPAWLWYAMGVVIWLGAAAFAVRSTLRGIDRVTHGDSGIAAFLGRLSITATVVLIALGLGLVAVQAPQKSLFVSGYEPLRPDQVASILDDVTTEAPGIDDVELRVAASAMGERPLPDELARALVRVAPEHATVIRETVDAYDTPVRRGLTAGEGLRPPEWLLSSRWAKTAIVIMGVWMLVGGSNMLLYLAGLSNIPPELYEAADIDGATGWQRFINVTWPQLAPTTFFIVVMSMIAGIQGGFEQAMVMTEGKADTITLTYYLYNVAFTDRFELGLASAIAWIMFALIFVLTIFNFRLGSQLTNE